MKTRHGIALGACVATFAFGTSAALAQGSMSTNNTPATYQAAQAAGQAAQKVAPPNLVLPADMGGGTWGQRSNTNSNTNNSVPATGTQPSGTMNNNSTTPTTTTPNTSTAPNTNTGTSTNTNNSTTPPNTGGTGNGSGNVSSK
ncbi:MAG: hypothetical protein JO349_04240 [Candidatus Eremiobacteraeota bacterium]|nr:hypothetical protein [Candidatus Eremiobacteraeota bacterium]